MFSPGAALEAEELAKIEELTAEAAMERNLIDTTNDAMTFGLACNILSTGAYFKKKAGRRSSVKRYFFVGYGTSSTGFLKYFKDHSAASGATTPRGSFDLMDLVRANWDGLQHSITLTQSTKKDPRRLGTQDEAATEDHPMVVKEDRDHGGSVAAGNQRWQWRSANE
eukprot:Skav215682  [mRNA]  locus=scaffold278:213239:217518:- [translate_table: standard]